jgi:hypothetical protein
MRKKSNLTRSKVHYSPRIARTRHTAGFLGQASIIGSFLYNALPGYWRQGWMYRSFTGLAFTLLKKGKKEIQQLLWQRYVEIVVSKQPETAIYAPLPGEPKRGYRKLNSSYLLAVDYIIQLFNLILYPPII